MENWLTIWCRI